MHVCSRKSVLHPRSKTEYLRQVRKLADLYIGRELGRIKEREVFDYLIHLRDTQKLRPSTLNQAVVALRMFFRDYAGLKWILWEQFTIRRDLPLPVVLTRAETRQLLRTVQSGRFRAVLLPLYVSFDGTGVPLRKAELLDIHDQQKTTWRGLLDMGRIEDLIEQANSLINLLAPTPSDAIDCRKCLRYFYVTHPFLE